jgi:hypothetical protein
MSSSLSSTKALRKLSESLSRRPCCLPRWESLVWEPHAGGVDDLPTRAKKNRATSRRGNAKRPLFHNEQTGEGTASRCPAIQQSTTAIAALGSGVSCPLIAVEQRQSRQSKIRAATASRRRPGPWRPAPRQSETAPRRRMSMDRPPGTRCSRTAGRAVS